MTITAEKALTGMLTIRTAMAASTYLAPRPSAKVYGLDPANNPQLPYLGRVYAARDLALAAGTIKTTGPTRRTLLQLCLAIDIADTVSALAAGKAGYIPRAGAAFLTAAAVSAAVLGAYPLLADEGSA